MTDETTPRSPISIAKPAAGSATTAPKRPKRPRTPLLFDDGFFVLLALWFACVTFQSVGVPLLAHGHLNAGNLRAYGILAVWPAVGMVWRLLAWLHDLARHRDKRARWRDAVEEWEFDRRSPDPRA